MREGMGKKIPAWPSSWLLVTRGYKAWEIPGLAHSSRYLSIDLNIDVINGLGARVSSFSTLFYCLCVNSHPNTTLEISLVVSQILSVLKHLTGNSNNSLEQSLICSVKCFSTRKGWIIAIHSEYWLWNNLSKGKRKQKRNGFCLMVKWLDLFKCEEGRYS